MTPIPQEYAPAESVLRDTLKICKVLNVDFGHILLVDNYLILSLKSTRELSNYRPIKYVLKFSLIFTKTQK